MTLMAAARPGSARWLVLHEIRLGWRSGVAGRKMSMWLVIAVWLLLHLPVALAFRHWANELHALPPWMRLILGGATWGILGLMLAVAIGSSAAALFNRGDLDLLLSSPLPTRAVFIARGMGIAVDVGNTLLFLLSPLANVGALFGFWNLLAIYAAVPALALGVTALGMTLCLLLVRILGARRTRSLGQVLGTLLGAAVFIATQLPRMSDAPATGQLVTAASGWARPDGPLSPDSPLWLPSRALGGAPLPLLAMLVAGVGAFWLAARLVHGSFAAGTQESVNGSAVRTLAPPRAGSTRFQASLWRTVLMKEWRLMARDLPLLSKTLMQLVYIVVPMGVFAMRQTPGASLPDGMLGPGAVFLASSLAGGLAWITVAAEDAPELLRSAPVPLSRLHWAKALAALLPAWGVALPLQLFAALSDPWSLPGLVFCMVGSTVSAAAVQVWFPTQEKRSDMGQRGQTWSTASVIGSLAGLAWMTSAICLNFMPILALVPLLFIAVVLGAAWLLGRARRAAG
jgi:ABC-2 type transport system permease protein